MKNWYRKNIKGELTDFELAASQLGAAKVSLLECQNKLDWYRSQVTYYQCIIDRLHNYEKISNNDSVGISHDYNRPELELQ